MEIRTDLALEARENLNKGENFSGVISEISNIKGFDVTTVKVTNETGAKALDKPVGSYITFEVDPFLIREKGSFETACGILSDIIKTLTEDIKRGTVLVAGLGNKEITSDALGPFAVKNIVITRHLVEKIPEHFGKMRPVAGIAPGVLATTGMETEEIVKSIVSENDISAVIAIDALASRSLDRLCRTVQISDTGIVPGSGVGNHRNALNRETLGIPVIAIGVPTVVFAGTLVYDVVSNAGGHIDKDKLSKYSGDLIVTPRDIDENIRDMAKLIGYGINLALQDITTEDINLFLS